MGGAHRDRTQLRQRTVGCTDEGLKPLVLRIAQGERQLRDDAHCGSGAFGEVSTMIVGLSMYESSTIADFSPAYRSLWR
ncbi:hypothetical protein D3C81_2199080 [compost metagenome]